MWGTTRRFTRVGRPTLRSCVLALAVLGALFAVAAFVGVAAARAENKPNETVSASSSSLLDEIAGALGFSDSSDPGFWEAYQASRQDELARIEDERVKANEAIADDALTYGRRIEEPSPIGTRVVELIPGDDGAIHVRIAWEQYDPNTGALVRTTRYFRDGDPSAAAIVTTVVKDGVEKVTKVEERVPGTTDLKVGDSRPVPPETTSKAGKKPSSLDPRSDGSLGRASGAHPEESKRPEPGVRHEFEALEAPDGRRITPFLEEKPIPGDPAGGVSLVTGIDLSHPSWGNATAHVAVVSDKHGKAAAILASVTDKSKNTETLVKVIELVPGAAGGLKEGDTRPIPADGGPKSWTPTASGDSQKDAGTGAAAAGDDSAEPAPKGDDESDAAAGQKPIAEEHPDWQFHGSSSYNNSDGTSVTVDVYDTPGGGSAVVATTKDADENTTRTERCYQDGKEVSCDSGLTDEPACTSGCERLEALAALFCSGCDGGFNPLESSNGDPSKGPRPALPQGSWTYPIAIPGWAWSNPDHAGGPKDFGDPNDPNKGEAVSYLDPRYDGNLDPVEPEIAAGEVADTFAHDLHNALYDPAGPQDGSGTEAPEGTPPNPGDAD
jgi:hypothetical protein